MFFSKKPTTLYLQKNGFLLYSTNNLNGIELKFPDQSITNGVISDENKFSDAIQTFMAENNLQPSDAIIVLSSELISQKQIEGKTSQEQQEEVNSFIKSSSTKEDNLAKETFELDGKKYILITDKVFFQAIAREFRKLEWNIISVIPISLFRELSDSKMKKNGISQKELQEINSNIKLVKAANMLSEEEDKEEEKEEKKEEQEEKKEIIAKDETQEEDSVPTRSFSLNRNVIYIGVIILLLCGLGFLYTQGVFSSLLNTMQPKKEVVEVAKEQPTPTPTQIPTEEDKTKLTVQVLNGTGITGQAGKVKTRLEKLDYSEIKTANGDTKENTTTTITFSSKVSKDYRDEIIKDLEDLFETVESVESKEDDEFDIVVLTGTEIE